MEIQFKQKLSFRTQMALVEIIGQVRDSLHDAGETEAKWTGEFVLSYNSDRRYPRLVIGIAGSSFGKWFTFDNDLGVVVGDNDLSVMVQG